MPIMNGTNFSKRIGGEGLITFSFFMQNKIHANKLMTLADFLQINMSTL